MSENLSAFLRDAAEKEKQLLNQQDQETTIVDSSEGQINVKNKHGEEIPIDTEVFKEDQTTPSESIANLESYYSGMDKELQTAKEEYEIKKAEEENIKRLNERKKESRTFQDNIVYLEEEEEKIIEKEVREEKTNKRNIDLSSITIKRSKKLKEEEIAKKYMGKINDKSPSTRIVAINSGYAANMEGLSSPALRNISAELAQYDRDFGATDYRYRLVHSKIKDSSVGKMEYVDFLKSTSLLELELFFYGIVCSTYPDKNQFPAKCPKCSFGFKYDYYNSDYLKVDEDDMDDITNKVAALLKGQAVDAREILENAPTHTLTRKILDDSGIIVELRHPTLYDHLYDVLKNVEDREPSVLINSMPFIETVLVPEEDEDGEVSYFPLESVDAKLTVLESISENDDLELAESIKDIIDSQKITFSIHGVTCPRCKHEYPEQTVSMEQMLFMIHQIRITNK